MKKKIDKTLNWWPDKKFLNYFTEFKWLKIIDKILSVGFYI